jgi:hypothetical protein
VPIPRSSSERSPRVLSTPPKIRIRQSRSRFSSTEGDDEISEGDVRGWKSDSPNASWRKTNKSLRTGQREGSAEGKVRFRGIALEELFNAASPNNHQIKTPSPSSRQKSKSVRPNLNRNVSESSAFSSSGEGKLPHPILTLNDGEEDPLEEAIRWISMTGKDGERSKEERKYGSGVGGLAGPIKLSGISFGGLSEPIELKSEKVEDREKEVG